MTTTRLMDFYEKQSLEIALITIIQHGLIAFPTDTVYGLAGSFHDSEAIQKIFVAKGREFSKAIAVLIGEIDQLELVASTITPVASRLAERFWPGALTLLLPRNQKLPELLSPYPTIGVRIPNHIRTRQLLRLTGPLATTSANRSGNPDPITAQDVQSQLDGLIDLILDGGTCSGGVPSTVVDCTKDEPVILRVGAITKENIFALF